MLENPEFEQNHYSRKAKGKYKIGNDSVILMKSLPNDDIS